VTKECKNEDGDSGLTCGVDTVKDVCSVPSNGVVDATVSCSECKIEDGTDSLTGEQLYQTVACDGTTVDDGTTDPLNPTYFTPTVCVDGTSGDDLPICTTD
jgi:hypothetical protein